MFICFFGGTIGVGMVAGFCPPDVAFSRFQAVMVYFTYFFVMTAAKYYTLNKKKDFSEESTIDAQFKRARILAGLAFCCAMPFMLWMNARRNMRDLELKKIRARDRRLVINIVKFSFTFFGGFYACLIFATDIFPKFQKTMNEKTVGKTETTAAIMQGNFAHPFFLPKSCANPISTHLSMCVLARIFSDASVTVSMSSQCVYVSVCREIRRR